VFLGKSGGILSSPILLQPTSTPAEWVEHLHTLGHDDATPTSNITATIAVIRKFQSKEPINLDNEKR
jgi:hypothetical protein